MKEKETNKCKLKESSEEIKTREKRIIKKKKVSQEKEG